MGAIGRLLGLLRLWFSDRGRNIFHFWDGKRWVRCDPIEIGERLERKCPDYQDLLDVLAKRPGDIFPGPLRDDLVKRQADAARRLAELSGEVFGLAPLGDSSGGLTRGERVAVIGRYFNFMEGLARKAELFPAWPQEESPSLPASPTGNFSESGGVGNPSN